MNTENRLAVAKGEGVEGEEEQEAGSQSGQEMV